MKDNYFTIRCGCIKSKHIPQINDYHCYSAWLSAYIAMVEEWNHQENDHVQGTGHCVGNT